MAQLNHPGQFPTGINVNIGDQIISDERGYDFDVRIIDAPPDNNILISRDSKQYNGTTVEVESELVADQHLGAGHGLVTDSNGKTLTIRLSKNPDGSYALTSAWL